MHSNCIWDQRLRLDFFHRSCKMSNCAWVILEESTCCLHHTHTHVLHRGIIHLEITPHVLPQMADTILFPSKTQERISKTFPQHISCLERAIWQWVWEMHLQHGWVHLQLVLIRVPWYKTQEVISRDARMSSQEYEAGKSTKEAIE